MNAAQYSVHEAWQPALPPPRRPAPPASHASRKRQSQHWRCAAAGSAFITVQVRAGSRLVARPAGEADRDRREAELSARERRERRGRRGEDVIIAARERGLRVVELLFGLAAGPLAAVCYPWLRETAAELITGEQKLCFAYMGLCGSVPEAMQVFFRNTVGLLFSFLLGYTSSFLLVRQEKFYEAMYEESSVLTQLLEEAPLLLNPPELQTFVRLMKLYLASSTWRNASFIPSELVARALRSDKDPVEEMTRLLLTIPGAGAQRMLSFMTSLRSARSRKYSSMQRIIPTTQFGVLVLLALLITLSPFLDGKSDSSVLAQCLYGVLVEILIFVIVYVGGGPGLGIYTTDKERATILDALMQLIDKIDASARESTEAVEADESNMVEKRQKSVVGTK